MAANRIHLQHALHKPYDRLLFSREVLSPVFGSGFTLNSTLVPAAVSPNKSESAAIDKVWIYGKIELDDNTEISCYEVLLQPKVRIEQSKVAIQHYVRKLLTAGQAALINFVAPANKNVWRLTLVAKDSVLTDKGVKEKTTNAKRYTFLLGPSETCKTAAERFEVLSTEKNISFQTLVNAFSVEKLSKAFFDEYTLHYQNFCNYLQESNYRRSVFNISFSANATKQEKDKASKPIRDFVKKLLGRIVFLYFVQKKAWLGASDTNYSDGLGDFIKQLFDKSGGNDIFYSNWLTVLFFDTLNKERTNDDFKMPDEKTVKVPFLNGGLFDKEKFDEHLLTFPSKLFHHTDFEDDILTAKSKGNARGFLDFLDAFNFTVYEDSPDDQTVAVDPEMLGHIFENLLEDNKDKGAFYTPKEIVHYMCQESLTEYLCTALQIKDEGAEREAVNHLLKNKVLDEILKPKIAELEKALDNVKICDPAIGSGAFPMGLLQEIFSIKELIAYETGKEWKPAETKLNIIQNSIYGVDIEKGAVDIARLRFWLSLVVDEEKPKPLPNLDYKIVVGDSLISKFDGEIVEIDWGRKQSVGKADDYVKNVQRLLVEVADKQKNYFNPNNKNKKKLQAEIRNLKIELLINQLSYNKLAYMDKMPQKGGFTPSAADIKHNTERELQIRGFDNQITKLKNLLKNPDAPFNHFDWKLDFPEVLNPYLVNDNGGFDIVIGNPPYNQLSKNPTVSEDYKIFLKQKFGTSGGRLNTFIFFIHFGVELLKTKGIITYIIPNTILTQEYYKDTRKFLLDRTQLTQIVSYDKLPFENAIVENITFFAIRANLLNYSIKHFFHKDNGIEIDKIKFKQDFQKSELCSFSFGTNELTDSMLINTVKLSSICNINQAIALKGDKSLSLRDSNPKGKFYKLLDGRNINKYLIEWGGIYLDYDIDKIHSCKTKDIFTSNEKLMFRRVSSKLIFCYDNEQYFALNTIVVVNLINSDFGYNIKYLLGILNSRLLDYYYCNMHKSTKKVFSEIQARSVGELPIKQAKKDSQKLISKVVDYIVFLKKQTTNDIDNKLIPTYFEQIIDSMVYELYFPELLKKHNREIIKHLGELPEFTDNMTDEQKMNICKKVFDRLNDKEHPVRINLEKMKEEIKEIRIIAGL